MGMRPYTHTVPNNALTLAVAAELRRLRKAQGLSQTDLADMTGFTRGSIQRWETGGSIKIEEMADMTTALGDDPTELFGRAAVRAAEARQLGVSPATFFSPSNDTIKRV